MSPSQSSLTTLGARLAKDGPYKQEPSPRRVRILFGGAYIADTLTAQYVWEHPYYPQYYIPVADIAAGVLQRDKDHIKDPEALNSAPPSSSSAQAEPAPATDGQVAKSSEQKKGSGKAYLATLKLGNRSTKTTLAFEGGALDGLVRFNFGDVDAWYEEDQQIYVHPKDPYKRVDILPSTRKIEIKIDNVTVASTSAAVLLFETSLPTRYYLPATSVVDVSGLRNSETLSKCPYKGEANYYSIVVNGKEYKDIIWYYRNPTIESISVAGRICFYNEKVDIFIDGVKQERPKTHFS